MAMVAGFTWKNWKTLLALATAFTIGHSVTLVLGGLDAIHFASNWVEIGIALSIALAGLFRIINSSTPPKIGMRDYAINIFFGLIHGMGFSQTIRMMMDNGNSGEHVQMLFLFNLGVEVGQIVVLLWLLALVWLFTSWITLSIRKLQMIMAGIAGAVGLWLVIERLPNLF
jgi:hypothetical protein